MKCPGKFQIRYTRVPTEDGTGERQEPDLYETCSYCGSLRPETFIEMIQKPGVHWSGSDWKYGWPHKFYIDIPCEPYWSYVGGQYGPGDYKRIDYGWRSVRHHKFYSEHIIDRPDLFEQWSAVVTPKLGIRWFTDDDGRVMYEAPRGGFQSWGTNP